MKKIFTLISIFSVSAASLWAQATPNPGFENWTNHSGFGGSYDTPDNWDNANSQSAIVGTFGCIKATAAADIHSGSAAIKLITKSILGITAPGVATTGTLPTSATGSITGGIPYTLRPDSIVGFYKYTPQGGDNGFVVFALLGSNSDTIAVASYTPVPVTAYHRFSAPLVYKSTNAVTTSLWIIGSSGGTSSAVVGSTLFADDLSLVFNSTTGISEQKKLELTVGPNPATDRILIKNTLYSNAVLVLYDVTGRKVAEEKIGNATNSLDVSAFPIGLYIYSITDEHNTTVKSGKLIIQK